MNGTMRCSGNSDGAGLARLGRKKASALLSECCWRGDEEGRLEIRDYGRRLEARSRSFRVWRLSAARCAVRLTTNNSGFWERVRET